MDASTPISPVSSERAIANLIARYSHAVDSGDLRAVGELFAHGQLDTGLQLVEGSAAVEATLRQNLQRYPDGTLRTAHITTNLLVEVDEAAGTATATSYLTILQADPDSGFPLQPILAGRYHDQFQRQHGAWQFRTRKLVASLVGDLSRHATPASGFTEPVPVPA